MIEKDRKARWPVTEALRAVAVSSGPAGGPRFIGLTRDASPAAESLIALACRTTDGVAVRRLVDSASAVAPLLAVVRDAAATGVGAPLAAVVRHCNEGEARWRS